MPDLRLPDDIDAVAASIPVEARGLAELRWMLGQLPASSPSQLPGTQPVLLPEGDGTTSSVGGAGTGIGPGAPGTGPTTLIGGSGSTPSSTHGTTIIPRTLPPSAFDPTIRPPLYWTDTSLPATTNYPDGSLLFWGGVNGDGKLYRQDGGTWTVAVSGADIIANSITGGKIEAGAIGASHIQVGARSGGNLVANPGFENLEGGAYTQPVAWTYNYEVVGGGPMGQGTDTATKRNGNNALVLYCDSTRGGAYASAGFPVSAGQKLYLEASYYSTSTVTKGFYFRILYDSGSTADFARGDADTYHDVAADVGATGGVWTTVKGYNTVPAGAKWARVAVYLWMPNTTTYGLWDDISCTVLPGGVENSTGEVIIDSSGITILNGRLAFQDAYGDAALNGYGFAGGLANYLSTGLYNALFRYNGGSISAVPFWSFTAPATGSISLLSATSYPGGAAVRTQFGALSEWSDHSAAAIPVTGFYTYGLSVFRGIGHVAGTISLGIEVAWYRDETTDYYLSTDSQYWTFTADAADDWSPVAVMTAPQNAGFARVHVYASESGSHSASNTVDIGGVRMYPLPVDENPITYTPALTNFGTATLSTQSGWYYMLGKMAFVDIRLVISAAGTGGGTLGIALPYAPATTLPQWLPLYYSGMTGLTTNSGPGMCVVDGSTAPHITALRSADGAAIARSNLAASAGINIQGWYRT